MAFSFLYLAVRALLGALVRSRRGLHVKDIELLVLPEGRHFRCRASSGGSVVLVDEAAEAVMTVNRAADWLLAGARRFRWAQVERVVRPLTVVVVGVDAKDVLEVAPVQDQQPVEALRADGTDEPLCDRVRLWCPHRR